MPREAMPQQSPVETQPPVSPEEDAVLARFRPFAELFYLVASADGVIDADERHVMRGAFESLTGGRVARDRLLALEAELMTAAAGRDREDLLEGVCCAFAREREDAELAFTLAAVVAYANRAVDGSESLLVKQLASWLGISQTRAGQLVKGGQRSLRPALP